MELDVKKNIVYNMKICDPDLVQAFLKKWWVESDFKAPNLPLKIEFL
jgi:hypothetical protein